MASLEAAGSSTEEIPVIDLSSFRDEAGDSATRDAVALRLDHAASEVGFFYLSLPGLAEAASGLLKRCNEFHDLPEMEKMAVSNRLSPLYRGYNVTWRPGNGGSCAARATIDPPDPKEVMMFGSEELGEGGGATRRALHNGRSPMHGPNLWPAPAALPEGWRAALEDDWATLLAGARTLAVALARALGEPPDAFEEAMRAPASVLLLLRYDSARLVPGSTTGCGAHTDCGFLTFLVQEPSGAPLQVQRGSMHAGTAGSSGAAGVDAAAWVAAPFTPGCVLVNLGDMLARWTNGRYRSTVHRVLLDDGGDRGAGGAVGEGVVCTQRHSVAFFANPSYYTPVACFPSCCAPAEGMPPPQFEATTAGKYISGRLGLMYEEPPTESA